MPAWCSRWYFDIYFSGQGLIWSTYLVQLQISWFSRSRDHCNSLQQMANVIATCRKMKWTRDQNCCLMCSDTMRPKIGSTMECTGPNSCAVMLFKFLFMLGLCVNMWDAIMNGVHNMLRRSTKVFDSWSTPCRIFKRWRSGWRRGPSRYLHTDRPMSKHFCVNRAVWSGKGARGNPKQGELLRTISHAPVKGVFFVWKVPGCFSHWQGGENKITAIVPKTCIIQLYIHEVFLAASWRCMLLFQGYFSFAAVGWSNSGRGRWQIEMPKCQLVASHCA